MFALRLAFSEVYMTCKWSRVDRRVV